MILLFGYITINKLELKVKDYYKYKSYYCGLCNALKEKCGGLGQITLSYDMTFLFILFTSLYEERLVCKKERCLLHPTQKHEMVYNKYCSYCAEMNLLLSYYNLLDDWKDEKKITSLVGVKGLNKKISKIESKYKRQAEAVKEYVEELGKVEQNEIRDIDYVAGLTGKMLAEIFVYTEDQWAITLRDIGFYLGKFIYLTDAYDDYEKDILKNNYNVFENQTISQAPQILDMMMSECTNEFEKLPLVDDLEIMRNILYSGVFLKIVEVSKRMSEGEKNDRR